VPELHSPNDRNAHSTPAHPSSPAPAPTRRSLRATAAQRSAVVPAIPRATAVPVSERERALYASQSLASAKGAASRPGREKARKIPGQKRAVALLTILVVPGFIATTSIPAFALGMNNTNTSSAAEYSDSIVDADDAQSIVASANAGVAVKRGAFDATTQEELDEKKAEAAAAALAASTLSAARSGNGGEYSTVGPRAAGDDYPWRGSSGLSPLRYVARQCTDFVAWRINRDAGSTSAPFKYDWGNMTPGGGNASAWAAAWKNNGWKTSTKPVNGAVAWFNGNHVAYVKSIDGNSVNLEEYNWGSSGAYHTRTIATSDVALFLYPPP